MSRVEDRPFAEALRPIDCRFGDLLRRKAQAAADTVALTGAILSAEASRGHSCLPLADWAGRRYPDDDGAEMPRLPEWRRDLLASGLVGDGRAPTPLVLDAADRAYLYRFWRAEQRIARHVLARLAEPPDDGDFEALSGPFRALFPDAGREEDWQAAAAAGCLRHRFVVVSGGPGTGKTHTAARVLALWLRRRPDLRVALAAPTGKAAARLTESVRAPFAELCRQVGADAAGEPPSARTLHRLLGYEPHRERFRHNAENRLPVDAVIVDEASMVDLSLMEALLEALPAKARVVLLGDSAQLASVETGRVLGDICRAAGRPDVSSAFAKAYGRLAGGRLPVRRAAGPLRDAVIELQKNWRFQTQPHLAEVAAAARAGDSEATLRLLEAGPRSGVERLDPPPLGREVAAFAGVMPLLRSVVQAQGPDEALDRLAGVRILCTLRHGPWGVSGVNAAIEARLRSEGLVASGPYYPGRPLLITANDYSVQLFNGDVGVCWRDGTGMCAWFRDAAGGPRRVSLGRLPDHETAWAVTVHKAQGSEFRRVWLALPAEDSPVLTREMLYTGLTRAREAVCVIGTRDMVRATLARSGVRASGLGDALVAGAPPRPVT